MGDDSRPEDAAVVGTTIAGKYTVDGIIGKGGMGLVASAIHRELDQRVAIKFLLPDMMQNDEAVRRFLREARLAARLRSDHSVRVFDVGTTDQGMPYMVMEHLVGTDLDEELHSRGPLPVIEVADWVQQAIVALAEAHVLGIVHRDLKPSNLFLAMQGKRIRIVKILDFGISKLESEKTSADLTSTKAILGSPSYMSPEQIRSSRSVDPRSDIWSLGIVMYQLLTKQLPFVSESDSIGELFGLILHTEPKSLMAVRPDLDPGLSEIVMRCLEKSRENRFPDVGKLAEAMLPYSSDSSLRLVELTKNAVRSLPPPRDPPSGGNESKLVATVAPARRAPKDGEDALAETADVNRVPRVPVARDAAARDAAARDAAARDAADPDSEAGLEISGLEPRRRVSAALVVSGIVLIGAAVSYLGLRRSDGREPDALHVTREVSSPVAAISSPVPAPASAPMGSGSHESPAAVVAAPPEVPALPAAAMPSSSASPAKPKGVHPKPASPRVPRSREQRPTSAGEGEVETDRGF